MKHWARNGALSLFAGILPVQKSRHDESDVQPPSGAFPEAHHELTRQGDYPDPQACGGTFTCHFASPSGPPREAAYPSFAKLISGLSGKLKSNKYLLQEGLDLITVKGSPVDFRALVQRNGDGQWSITSIVARIAGSQNFVSNLARGGRLSPVPEALAQSNLNGMLQKKVRAELSKGALEIAKGIETQIEAHFAELGIDLAADTRGRVLLLEINSKPSKEDNTPLAPSDEPKIRPSVRRVVQYARFLGQF
ncbi:YheC/YheD family protein [Paenibacillus sp. CC-CFT747]|nr:YheC/YheD family protein [Paenibacillus sp. CC-CFT747]